MTEGGGRRRGKGKGGVETADCIADVMRREGRANRSGWQNHSVEPLLKRFYNVPFFQVKYDIQLRVMRK